MGWFKKPAKAPEVRDVTTVKVTKADRRPRHFVEDSDDAQANCSHPATAQIGRFTSCRLCGADL